MASPASALGQKIGEAFDEAVLRLLKRHVDELGFDLHKLRIDQTSEVSKVCYP